MKKFLSVLLAVVLCFSVCSVVAVAADEDIIVKAVPSKTTLKRGDTFTVDFNITTNDGFNTLGLEVGYDDAILEVVCSKHKDGSKCNGARLPVTNMLKESPDGASNNAACSPYHTTNPYKIMWAFGEAEEDYVATGRIATLTFKVKDNAKIGATTITLDVDQAASIENGSYAAEKRSGVDANLTIACTSHIKDAGTVTKKATCTEKGTMTYECTECGTVMETKDIKATGHAWGNWEGTADAKCGQKGKETRVCANDANHKETRDTDALEHLWDAGTVTKKPTCTEKGTMTFECTRTDCNETKEEDIKATGHKYGDWVETTAPKCEVKGEETRECVNENCDKKETRPVNATGHKYGDWVETTAPKCEVEGEETRVCANDANHKETRPVDALGHEFDYENGVVTVEPDCTEEGEIQYPCINGCGVGDIEVLDALGHTVEWNIEKEATTTEEGRRTGTCSECGEELDETIPKLTATLEGDKVGIIVMDPETGDIDIKESEGFKIESADDEPFSGYVSAEIIEAAPDEEESDTVDGKKVAVAYIVSLLDSDTNEYVDSNKLITLTIPVSNAVASAYENLVLVGIDADGNEIILEDAVYADGAFVVTAEYGKLAIIGVAGDKIVVEDEKEDDKIEEDVEKEETTSPATGDATAIAFVIVMLAIAASVLVFTSKKVRA